MLTPNYGCVGATDKFTCSDTVSVLYLSCFLVDWSWHTQSDLLSQKNSWDERSDFLSDQNMLKTDSVYWA